MSRRRRRWPPRYVDIPRLHRGALRMVCGDRCAYCRRPLDYQDEITIDHVQPKSAGGAVGLGNVVIACHPCNAKKSNRPPRPCEMLFLQSINLKLVKAGWLHGG